MTKLYCEVARSVFPPKTKFTTDMIPDLSGRVTLVTGANTGVGKETVKALLEHNAKVYLVARSQTKAEAAIAELKAATGREAIFLQLDLSSLADVRRAAEEFLRKERELHILFNNAGVMVCPIDQFTRDGYDMQFGTNALGHFFFMDLLTPALSEGAKSSPDGYARIVTTSSSTSLLAEPEIHFETFKDHPNRQKLGIQALYAQSKLLSAIIAHEAAKRYADKKILSFSADPGAIKTDLQRHVTGVARAVGDLILHPAPLGALTQLYAGTMPGAVDHNGGYFVPWARVGKGRDEIYSAEIGKKVWEYLEEELKGR